MVVGVALMVSAFATTHARSPVIVGAFPTCTTRVIVAVAVCPTTTTIDTPEAGDIPDGTPTTVAHTTSVVPTTAGEREAPTTADPRDPSTPATTSDNPAATAHKGQLAFTGTPSITLLLAGVALLLLGLALLMASRRRPARGSHIKK